MRGHVIVVVTSLICWPCCPARAQPADDALRFGTIATLAPLCTLRDEAWAHDLRSAEIETLSQTTPHNDAVAILSFAEDEAAESFAETPAQSTCGPLGHNPDLTRADDVVNAYRHKAGS